MNNVGIILGTGGVASSFFYQQIVNSLRSSHGYQPKLLLYSINFTVDEENKYFSDYTYKSQVYFDEIKHSFDCFSRNDVTHVSFPCFSLSNYAQELSNFYRCKFVNPFSNMNEEFDDTVGVAAVNDSRDFVHFIESSLDRNIHLYPKFQDIYKVSKYISLGNNPNKYLYCIENIDTYFRNNKIKKWICACSELCIITSSHFINPLQNLIEYTCDLCTTISTESI